MISRFVFENTISQKWKENILPLKFFWRYLVFKFKLHSVIVTYVLYSVSNFGLLIQHAFWIFGVVFFFILATVNMVYLLWFFFSELPRRNAKILGKSQPIFGSICRRFEYQPQWWSVRGIKLTSVLTKKLSQHQQNICAVIFPIHFLRHKAKSDAFSVLK